jgi:hypothetical protein
MFAQQGKLRSLGPTLSSSADHCVRPDLAAFCHFPHFRKGEGATFPAANLKEPFVCLRLLIRGGQETAHGDPDDIATGGAASDFAGPVIIGDKRPIARGADEVNGHASILIDRLTLARCSHCHRGSHQARPRRLGLALQ